MSLISRVRLGALCLSLTAQVLVTSTALALGVNADTVDKYATLELLQDSPTKTVRDVVLMASLVSVDFQNELIQRLRRHGIQVFLTSSPSSKNSPHIEVLRRQSGVNVVDLNFETALWAQDRFFRFYDSKTNRSWLLPTISDSMYDEGALSGYELGVPLILGARFPERFAQLDDYVSHNAGIVSVDRGRGNLYFGEHIKNFVHGVAWGLAHGDGGDRLVTKNYMLIGQATYEKTLRSVKQVTGLSEQAEQHSFLEKVVKKKIIALGESSISDGYLFHLDMFLTPVESADGKLKVLFGSLAYTMNSVMNISSVKDLPTWASEFYWTKKIRAEIKLKSQLKSLGIEAVDVPIFFVEPDAFALKTGLPAIISFNNGIFSNKIFFAARYVSKRQDLNQLLQAAEKIVEARFEEHLGSAIEWVPGGEAIVGFGGGVRCMTGVITQAN